jgi:dihydroorotase-like cyclic amidohydrolase
MANRFDMLLCNGTIVDYASGRQERCDVATKDGLIAAIAPGLDPAAADTVHDVYGCHVLPGIIDMHVHASAWLGGRSAHRMLARAGVTTALDMSGPVDSVLDIAASCGAGLNLATIESVRPGYSVRNGNPDQSAIIDLLESSLRKGSIGLKILGGHYPLTPEATARVITVANRRRAYVACHAGTTATGSTLAGMLEALTLADGQACHIAHVNSYCRGTEQTPLEEAVQAIQALLRHPNIRSESYLSPLNGTSAKCVGGVPESPVTRRSLVAGGFPPTSDGLEQAILNGWAAVNVVTDDDTELAVGEPGLAWWRNCAGDAVVSFRVNPPEARLQLAIARRPQPEDGFVVDCISTDGGGIPRNVIVESGLALVELQAISLLDFVRKTSYTPSRILGLPTKGQLQTGCDADITVVDCARRQARMTIVAGQTVMVGGTVCGTGCRIVTTSQGAAAVRSRGLQPIIIDPAESAFYGTLHN